MIDTILNIAMIIFLTANLAILWQLSKRIQELKSAINFTVDRYIIAVKALGVAEGNVEGIATQVEIQRIKDEKEAEKTE